MLFDDIQNFCGEINQAACYALSLLHVAQQYNEEHNPKITFDVLDTFKAACSGIKPTDIIYYNKDNLEDNDNFYVQQPEILLRKVTGKKWTVTKCYDLNYEPKVNEYIIKYYERIKTGATSGHFERDNFHPIKNSATVKYGNLKSLRILKVIN